MYKHSGMLVALLLLTGCARQSAEHSEPSASTAQTSNSTTAGATVAAPQLPMSPLDPALQHSELAALPDVWLRIRQQMQLQVPDRADVRREIAFYASKQKFFNEMAARAEPYLYFIVTELEQRRMPIELALLPIVESAFNPAAQGNGPAGLWQMVPQTARNFGLKVQSGYDGRKDAVSSTYAVLDYLQHLHDNLGHDWLNAVAAYNTGEGRIMAAVERNKARGLPTGYWDLHIPARYVQTMPKWLAMIQLVQNPERYQLELPAIANQPAIGMTRIAGAVQLQQAAELAGISVATLKQLNPAFRLAMSPAGKEFPLVLPLHAVTKFEQQRHALKKVAVVQPPAATKGRSYTVKSGDNLGSIAARTNSSVKRLRQLNNLKSDQLKTGQILQLPATDKTTEVANRSSKVQTYQVKPGENLWTIAQKLRISADTLQAYNNLKTDAHLQPGQSLKVPPVKNATGSKTATVMQHTVKKGDSLDRIARKYKIKLADLLKWNRLQADSKLKPGQQLYLAPRRQS